MRQGSVRGEVEQIETGTFPQNVGSHVDSKRIIYAQGRVKLLLIQMPMILSKASPCGSDSGIVPSNPTKDRAPKKRFHV